MSVDSMDTISFSKIILFNSEANMLSLACSLLSDKLFVLYFDLGEWIKKLVWLFLRLNVDSN